MEIIDPISQLVIIFAVIIAVIISVIAFALWLSRISANFFEGWGGG